MDALTGQISLHPSYLQSLLDRFAFDTGYVPASARLLRETSDLPLALVHHAVACDGMETVWRAWTDDFRIWFIVGMLSGQFEQTLESPVLHVLFFGTAGDLASSGTWRRDAPGHWTLCML